MLLHFPPTQQRPYASFMFFDFKLCVFQDLCVKNGVKTVEGIHQIFTEEAVQKKLRSEPWTEATFNCTGYNPPAGGRTATKGLGFLIYCLDNVTYYTE